MASTKPRVGFAGLGAMGGGMAKNLVKEGFEVTGFDVYQPLVDSFVEAGGKPAKTPREAAENADFFVSMVANAAQNSSLLLEGEDAVIKGLGKGKTFILCSTTPPAFLHELRKGLDESGRPDIKLLDCPVSGGTIRAANGTLSIFESGPEVELDEAAQVLQTMSGNLYRMGGISAGTKTKTIHQLLAAVNIITASEALALAATVGLNTQAVTDHVNKSDGASFMFENRSPHALKNDWHPYSALAIIQKDAIIVADTARKDHYPVPVVDTAEQLYLQGEQAGLLRLDDAALVQLYLPKSQGDLVSIAAKADVNMTESHQVSKDTIVDLLAGIHLAGSVEGMAFCKHLGVDRKTMYEIISKAAGWNAMFTRPDTIQAMLEKDSWSLADCPAAEEVGRKLSEAVEKCRLLQFPCPMANIALQQYFFAGLAKKQIGKQDRGGHS
ncbi:Putative 6-phosphogluconate dehydrogenase, NADP-binding, 6-phosphogluconate dehydrogenase, domain 2 [Septoria linicola]|uniref:6-phosphogluconate dehydrogenase, NADP-binding, 6-phosphogluconate dehydrogenase, domain 2 n=1 Tax=Septoria linicola TaxID=215465 RepID=A0A9Q9EMC7_9PEZI|nr:Putative 6-phosphogluconate dehydrogenase, NADP-binding, 6-phosphogluconate dehydrogenase, domain 2 [Septoria linicola]